MKCRFFTAIVLAVAMLVSFGLCNLSVAAYSDSGAIYNDAQGVYVQLGTYENEFSPTGNPFEVHYSVDTFADSYQSSEIYSSRLKGTSTYETYYEALNVYGQVFEAPIFSQTAVGEPGETASISGDDNDASYEVFTNNLPTLRFFARLTNVIKSHATTEFYGSKIRIISFGFLENGVYFNY